MLERDLKVTIGGLLHDIGKVIYRDGLDSRTHSISGYDYLKDEINMKDEDILECVKYHHRQSLKGSNLDEKAIAYIVYIADNIASSVDRRLKEEEEKGFEIHTPLQPVFNLLNENTGKKYYSSSKNNVEESINYPIDEKQCFSQDEYKRIMFNISDNLKGIDFSPEYINSLLEVLEANLSFVPSSTSNAEVPDISLFDHSKITAAIASSIVQYLDNDSCTSYKDSLFDKESEFYEKKAFLIASIDLSGIQNFIYTIQSKNALKTLRARSFYLEIVMEHIIDELLTELGLSRCNLLYVGGGHCYFILPNTEKCKDTFSMYLEKVNQWFLEKFQTKLYAAGGYAVCTANNLKNNPKGSYQTIFKNVSQMISDVKIKRYNADTIRQLNSLRYEDYSRECVVCKGIAKTNEEGRCPICEGFEKFSGKVLYSDFFTIVKNENEGDLPLPGNFGLTVDTEQSLKNRMDKDDSFIRAYSKNRSYTGKHIATKLWVGSYTTKATFAEFASESTGIKRVGILRADVDNLGHAFVAGFKNSMNDDRYVTISRTATLSRQLSLFFKLHINKILDNPKFTFDGKMKDKRNITIVYSGGDDIFAVGSWNEIIEFAIDLRNSFDEFTEKTLSISCGIGLYDAGYPISVSAEEVEDMVDKSKSLPNKNAITLLEDGCVHSLDGLEISDGTYIWKEFIDNVLMEKYKLIDEYMTYVQNEHGNALLYRILELIRHQDKRINFARFVYMLSRLEPDENASKEKKEVFRGFSEKMIKWVTNEQDRRHLKTAIELYVYLNRGEE